MHAAPQRASQTTTLPTPAATHCTNPALPSPRLPLHHSPSPWQVAAQYVGDDRQLQRTLVQSLLLAGELSLAEQQLRLFGLQARRGWAAVLLVLLQP